MPTVILSDQQPVNVRRLGIFELDKLRPEPLGPFTYEIEILGKKYDAIFDPNNYETPPKKPDIDESEIVVGSKEWYALNDYKLYQAAIVHQQKRHEMGGIFIEKVATYILQNCIDPDDVKRIVTYDDWAKVYEAALVPQLTVEVLAKSLQQTYQAEFEGQDVFTALNNIESDQGGAYDTLRLWETQLMVQMHMTEVEYAALPLEERARKVCAMNLPQLMEALEYHRKERTRAKESLS